MLPFRLRRFFANHFIKYFHTPIEEYDIQKHIPARKGNKRFLIEKASLNKKNNSLISIVIISDAEYFILAHEQIQSILIVEPETEIFVFDAGLLNNQKQQLQDEFPNNIRFEVFDIEQTMATNNLRRSEAMFYYKIHAVSIALQKTKNKIIIYSDAANVFLKPLNELKNFVQQNGFYGGMTEVFGYERIQQYKQFRDCAEALNMNIYNNHFLLTEGGFWAIDTEKQWVKSFVNEYKALTQNHLGVFQIFPHDMVAMSLLLAKYAKQQKFVLQEIPNIRFLAILEKSTVMEKNMRIFDYNTEKIPFFGYAVHNCSNHPDAPEKRRCSIKKDDIKTYIKID